MFESKPSRRSADDIARSLKKKKVKLIENLSIVNQRKVDILTQKWHKIAVKF